MSRTTTRSLVLVLTSLLLLLAALVVAGGPASAHAGRCSAVSHHHRKHHHRKHHHRSGHHHRKHHHRKHHHRSGHHHRKHHHRSGHHHRKHHHRSCQRRHHHKHPHRHHHRRGHLARRGAHVVRIAASLRGTPYRWGATGPHAFDCSGLTSWVYRHVGVRLPRTAAEQAHATRHVSHRAKRPGDLVFFASHHHVYHVGIYAGHHSIWHAPHTGAVVRREHLWTRAYGVGRVR